MLSGYWKVLFAVKFLLSSILTKGHVVFHTMIIIIIKKKIKSKSVYYKKAFQREEIISHL